MGLPISVLTRVWYMRQDSNLEPLIQNATILPSEPTPTLQSINALATAI